MVAFDAVLMVFVAWYCCCRSLMSQNPTFADCGFDSNTVGW
jgi:hypothetical protein